MRKVRFPKRFLIRIIDRETRVGIPGIAVTVILFAPEKNNYTIPLVTDSSGQICLTEEDVRRSIQEYWELFPMDYASPLEECSSEIEISTCSPEDVRGAVDAMKLFGPTRMTSNELVRAFEQSINDHYLPTTKRINVEETNPTEIVVARREN